MRTASLNMSLGMGGLNLTRNTFLILVGPGMFLIFWNPEECGRMCLRANDLSWKYLD